MRFETFCDQLVSAAANGIGQGLIVAIVAGLCLRLARGTNAATRHAVWFATLFLIVALIPANCLRGRFSPSVQKKLGLNPVAFGQATAATPAPDIETLMGVLRDDLDASFTEEWSPAEQSQQTTATAALRAIPLAAESSMPQLAHSSQVLSQLAERLRFFAPVSLNLANSFLPRWASMALLAAGLLAVASRLSVLAWRLFQLRQLKQSALPATGGLNQVFQELRGRLAANRRVELRLSPLHRSPVVLGFVHPVVVLPQREALNARSAEIEQIFRHELAHVRRWDDWANLVQHLIGAAVFFHPAVWWVSKQLSIEREIACDDCVLQAGGGQRAYALLLTDLAGRLSSSVPLLAPGVSTNKSQLQQRIRMILDTRRNTSPRLAKTRLGIIAAAAALMAALALYCAPRVVLAQSLASSAPAAGAAGASGNYSIAAVAATPAPETQSADAESDDDAPPGTPAPADVNPGPKFKPGKPSPHVAHPVAPVPPETPIPPTPAIAPMPPHAVYAPHAMALAQPTPGPGAPRDRSIEKRLERLEQMMESMMAEQNPKRVRARAGAREGSEPGDAFVWQWQPGNKGPFGDPKKIELFQERAEREAAAGAEQAKRAAEDARRASQQIEKSLKAHEEWRAQGLPMEAAQKQIEALRRARESLGREMENLERQIERLEREREKMDQPQQRRSELREEKSEEKSVAQSK